MAAGLLLGTLEETGLKLSPGIFDGGVRRFPTLNGAGAAWVVLLLFG